MLVLCVESNSHFHKITICKKSLTVGNLPIEHFCQRNLRHSSNLVNCITIYHYHLPPGCPSLRKEEPIPELFPQTPVPSYSWPRRTQVADKVVSPSCLGLPCHLVHSRGVHSVTLLVHLLSLNRAMCPAHQWIPFLITSMMSFTQRRRGPVVGHSLWTRPARVQSPWEARIIRCKNLDGLYIRDCESLCLSGETVKAVGPFYLVSMPGGK